MLFGIDATTYEIWRGTPLAQYRRVKRGRGQRRNRRNSSVLPKRPLFTLKMLVDGLVRQVIETWHT